jgi:2'-hydroxyisoflavone reductase
VRILCIGGLNGFTSSYFLRAAAERGHQVTVLTRGVRGASARDVELPDGVDVLVGDRFDDVEWTRDREWDAAIDFAAFDADDVRAMSELLRDRVGHYTMISSIAAYRQDPGVLDERSAVLESLDMLNTSAAPLNYVYPYGRAKVTAERAAARFGAPALIVRPGIILGPRDGVGHLHYWCARFARGGDIAVPGEADSEIQFVDSMDLAAWLVDMIERGETGKYNVGGEQSTLATLLTLIGDAMGNPYDLAWLSSEWMTARGHRNRNVSFWVKPDGIREKDEFWLSFRVSVAAAREKGYRQRPIAETVRDTVASFRLSPEADRLAAAKRGLGMEFDIDPILEAWRSSTI